MTTEPLPLNVSKRRCRDCRCTLPENGRMFRCPDCVLARLDRLTQKEDHQ
jgi:hypothetical protein